MKKQLLIIVSLAALFSCSKQTQTPQISTSQQANSINTFSIGQHYGGGIIFYIDSTGEHGLIADTEDLNPSAWYNGTYTTTGALKKGIGYGEQNTGKIILSQGDSGGYAARRCYNLTHGGFSDWFLPTLFELNEMYLHKNVIGGFVVNGQYWSSTEDKVYQLAWLIYFSGGAQGNQFKDHIASVRAIRKF